MLEQKSKILLVDDEVFNLKIMEKYLVNAGYETVNASDGLNAWELLESSHQNFDAVLLDWMMPNMDGMSLLKRIKAHEVMYNLPVIMQTAKSAKQDIVEGLEAGVHYYLTKPYNRPQLLAIVKSVVSNYRYQREIEKSVLKNSESLRLMDSARFSVRTLEEAYDMSTLLAGMSGNEKNVGLGLYELFVNALEHGNLGVGYAEKSELNLAGIWEDEVNRRLALPENCDKKVSVIYERNSQQIEITIEDEGDGFDWSNYMEICPSRAFDSHGRGIAMANLMSFDTMEYIGKGNKVIATYKPSTF